MSLRASLGHARGVVVVALLGLAAGAPAAWAQNPIIEPATAASPTPARLGQDERDLRGRSSIVLGSGARAYGMGGAFLARADDATAASWNPAGLSYLRRPELSLVGARHSARSVESDGSARVETDTSFPSYLPDFAALTYPVSRGPLSGAVQASFQRVVPFQSRRELTSEPFLPDEDRYATIRSRGGFDVWALGAGVRLPFGLRAGATVNRWFNGYSQDIVRRRPRALSGQQSADLGISGWNMNLGLLWTPVESLNVGLVAKTPFTAQAALHRERVDTGFDVEVEGKVVKDPREGRNRYPRHPDPPLSWAFAPPMEIEFPPALGTGVSWRPRSELTLSVDFTRTFWKGNVIRNYFTLPPKPPDQLLADPVLGTDLFPESPYPTLDDPGQNDSQQLRAGAEYVVILRALKMPVRGGYFRDRQIFRDVDGSSPTFKGYTFGLGLLLGPIALDAAFLEERGSFVLGRDASADPISEVRQTVKTRRILASIIYRHGAGR